MTLPSPNGCAACGADKDMHAQRWMPDVGWHTWIAPDDEVRKARMLARRSQTPEDPR